MTWWQAGVLANGTIGIAYLAISWIVLRGVHQRGGWRTDRLAVATGGIFLSCAAGHLAHLDHLVIGGVVGPARAAYDLHLAAVDGITAVVAVMYWSLRRRNVVQVSAGQMFDDAEQRLQEAAVIHDRVLQQLVTAKLALELDRLDAARAAVDSGITAASDLVLDLDPAGRIVMGEGRPPGHV